jgi:hypothetical protein
MLRKVYICALQVDAGRRLIWITPGATRGGYGSPPSSELRSSSTRYGVVETQCIASLPRVAPGVIQIRRLPASTCSAQKVLRNIYYLLTHKKVLL